MKSQKNSDTEKDYAQHEMRISSAFTSSLRSLAQENQIGFSTLVHGTWALLQSRYNDCDDVICRVLTGDLGIAINSIEPANTLSKFQLLRVSVASDKFLIPWLKEFEQQITNQEHKPVPLQDVPGWSDPPLFESIAAYDTHPLNAAWLGKDVTPAGIPWLLQDTGCPLALYACGDSELVLALTYDRSRFEETAAKRMLGHLKILLEGIAENPNRSLSTLPLLTDAERHQLLVKWNDTTRNYPEDMCLHRLFEAQVERTPENCAVVFQDQRLTYRELNQRANQLAHHLQKLGVGPEVLVCVFMERSIEMVVSLYATLKAGGAYVPVDPEYPSERIAFMLQDAGRPVILTQGHLAQRLDGYGNRVICVDTEWTALASESVDNPTNGVAASNIAYVIYTSGSTGTPKGAMNTHRGICNRLLWMQETYRLTDQDWVLQKTPYSFDVSVWEFFWPLIVGAHLVVAQPGGHKDSNYLVKLIQEHAISTLHFVPSMLQIFLDARDVEKCFSLKRVICSGEALPIELQDRFFATLGAELHNLYGPTEAAVDVTYWACQHESRQRAVPIGRPVANTQIYLLDRHMQPVPIGVPGELYIGGVQVARGYLNRPELTAQRFINDPFSNQPGARLYKTGDLARYLPDGSIDFLGRKDDQVKIRGFRIELGEIESVLVAHSGVTQAVVTVRDDGMGDRYLVAYLVPDEKLRANLLHPRQGTDQAALPFDPIKISPFIDNVRKFAKEKLPEYMVPSAFILLERLPLSPNGKLDRRALPAPSQERPNLESAFVAPRTELEGRLAQMWCQVLMLDQVGIHDRFFELGGNSLKAARFINLLQRELGEFIYIMTIFEKPTIAEYAALLLKDYSVAVAKWLGVAEVNQPQSLTSTKVTAAMVVQMRECIPTLRPITEDAKQREPKNPPALFILAPPRSGTTLLRVMLAGHPHLFAAPELNLLIFNNLQERQAAFTGKFSAWLEGAIRAIMELQHCSGSEAKRIMQKYEDQNYTTKQFYRVLQEWIDDRILVDKTPAYALDLAALRKAERDFENALYIHLVRHPYPTIRSIESMHMDQVLFLHDHPFTTRQLGELVWTISHQNISEFLAAIPENRQIRIIFEELVHHPQPVMEALCERFGLDFHPDLLQPYKDREKKMTDGIHPESQPMGDIKFLKHQEIKPEIADTWEQVNQDNFLGEVTWEVATALGYANPSGKRTDHADGSRLTSSSRKKLVEKQRQHRLERRKTLQ